MSSVKKTKELALPFQYFQRRTVYKHYGLFHRDVYCNHTLCGEVEKRGSLSTIGEFESRSTELVEEGVRASLQRSEARCGCVLQQPRTQSDRLWRGLRPEHLTCTLEYFQNLLRNNTAYPIILHIKHNLKWKI